MPNTFSDLLAICILRIMMALLLGIHWLCKHLLHWTSSQGLINRWFVPVQFCIYITIIVDVRCNNLSTPANGSITSCTSGIAGVGYEGDTCSFTCNSGYELTGSDTRTCQSDGSWNGNDVACIIKGKAKVIIHVLIILCFNGFLISRLLVYVRVTKGCVIYRVMPNISV